MPLHVSTPTTCTARALAGCTAQSANSSLQTQCENGKSTCPWWEFQHSTRRIFEAWSLDAARGDGRDKTRIQKCLALLGALGQDTPEVQVVQLHSLWHRHWRIVGQDHAQDTAQRFSVKWLHLRRLPPATNGTTHQALISVHHAWLLA